MATTLFIMEAVNLFCGDHDPTASNHLELMSMKLPDLVQETQEYKPGGGIGAFNMTMTSLAALKFTFKLKGMNPERLTLFGFGQTARRRFTAYGVVRDKRTNRQMESKAVIEGCLSSITNSEYSRGDGLDHDYEVNDVISASHYIDGKEIYDVDLFTNRFSIGGVSQTDEANRILRIPSVA